MSKNHNLFACFQSGFEGFKKVILKEVSFKYLLMIALLVIVAMFYFPLLKIEKLALVLVIFSVLTLELLNSSLERFLDYIQPKYDLKVREIKDVLTATVLLACIGSAIIGVIIFWPYVLEFIKRLVG